MAKPGRPKGSKKSSTLNRWCSVHIEPDLDDQLRKGAFKCGMTLSAAARILIREGLKPGSQRVVIALREAAHA